jgi:hypothetical protein
MRTVRNSPDLTPNSERRRVALVVAASIALPLVLMAVVSLPSRTRSC